MTVSVRDAQDVLKLDKTRPVHFVGIGGIGMSGLAKLLVESGFQVSGSDLAENANTQQLAAQGAQIYLGHEAGNVPANGVVIATTAVSAENPEIQQARELGMPVYHRSDLLREVLHGDAMGHQTTVGVSGSHGKTSVTGMLAVAFQDVTPKPTVVAGGIIPQFGTNAVLGEGRKLAIAELDESDGTLIQYSPTHSVILNLELDHPDHYQGGLDELNQTFHRFLSGLNPGSQVFFNWACPQTKALAESFSEAAPFESVLLSPGDIFTGNEPQVTYNLKNARDYDRGCYQGYIYKKNRLMGELSMTLPGMHQLFNGLCAVAVGDQLGFSFESMVSHLAGFEGMGRRFEKVGNYKGAMFIDDYAHHPTEVTAMVRVGRSYLAGIGRLIVVFQPHRYTRLQQFWDAFVASFEGTDILVLADVYPASEEPIEGITSARLVDDVKKAGKVLDVRYYGESGFDALREQLKTELQPGDMVMSLGAGNITQLLRGWDA